MPDVAILLCPIDYIRMYMYIVHDSVHAANCRHLKKLTCKGTFRQVFIRVYRLGYSQSNVDIFDPAL
jgi:hypothetical protein